MSLTFFSPETGTLSSNYKTTRSTGRPDSLTTASASVRKCSVFMSCSCAHMPKCMHFPHTTPAQWCFLMVVLSLGAKVCLLASGLASFFRWLRKSQRGHVESPASHLFSFLLPVYTFKPYLLSNLPVFAVLILHVIFLEGMPCLHRSTQIFSSRSCY